MNIVINGENRLVDGQVTISGLVELLGMKADRVAVELNLDIVPRDRWMGTNLAEGDRLEIVHFVGGGSGRPRRAGGQPMKKINAWTVLTLLLVSLAWGQGPTRFRPGFNLLSKEQDVQLGQ